jgi:5-methylcytosine-specific restriction enzyme A
MIDKSRGHREPEPWRRWYFTPQWRALRAAQLAREPLCRMCHDMGRQSPATVADHRRPHRGDRALFFDPANLDSLCRLHHDATKRRHERGRLTVALGVDGWPSNGGRPRTIPDPGGEGGFGLRPKPAANQW